MIVANDFCRNIPFEYFLSVVPATEVVGIVQSYSLMLLYFYCFCLR